MKTVKGNLLALTGIFEVIASIAPHVTRIILYLFTAGFAVSAVHPLEGVVIGPDRSHVAGAQVEVYCFKWQDGYEVQDSAITQTDPNGHFSIAVVPSRYIVALARKQGFSWGWKVIQAGQSSFSMQLTEPCPFDGQVVDESGNPLAEASVQIIILSKIQKRNGAGDPLSHLDDLQMFSTQTDAQGRFVFSGLPDGAGFDISIRKKGYAVFSSYVRGSLRYAYKAGTSNHQFVLEPEAILEGKLIESKTGRVSGIPVKLTGKRSLGFNLFPDIKTDRQGRFSFRELPADEYTLTIDLRSQSCLCMSRTVKLRKGQIKRDFAIGVYRGGVLSCRILNGGTRQPIQDAIVKLVDSHKISAGRMITGTDGYAQMHMLPNNYYITEVTAQGYRTDTTEHPLTIKDEKVISMTLLMDEYPRLEGVIVHPDDSPAENAVVRLLYFKTQQPMPGFSMSPNLPRSVRTDSKGRFSFWLDATEQEIEEGPDSYPVFAYLPGQNLYVADAVPVGLVDTQLTLKPGLKVIGSVVDQYGTAVEKGLVSLNISYKTGPNSSFTTSISAIPGYEGRFEFAGVPTDSQGLRLNYYCEKYKRFDGKIDPAQARNGIIQLQPIPVQRADVIVKGKVQLPDGRPVNGASVSTMDYSAGYDNDTTDEQGCFELTLFKLPVEIKAKKNIPPGGTHSGKVYASEKGRNVTITLHASDDKETFLPVVTPQQKSNQTEDRQKSETKAVDEVSTAPSGYAQLPREGGILFGASKENPIIDDFLLDKPLNVSKIRWWGGLSDKEGFIIHLFKDDGSGALPIKPYLTLEPVSVTQRQTPLKQFRGIEVFEYETSLEEPLSFEERIKYYVSISNKTKWGWFNSNSTGSSWWRSGVELPWQLREKPSADLAFELIP